MISRVLLSLSLLVSLVNTWWWLALPLMLFLVWRYQPYELILTGLLVDGYFGAFTGVPWYSLSAFGLYFVVSVSKPFILLYNVDNNEMVSKS